MAHPLYPFQGSWRSTLGVLPSSRFVSHGSEGDVSSAFGDGQNYFYVSNVRFTTLLEFGIEVGSQLAQEPRDRESVARLRNSVDHEFWNGFELDLDKYFLTIGERKFWASVFLAVAWRVFHRQIGNQDDSTWQVAVISECRMISLMLTHLVWSEERGWYPEDALAEGARPDPMRLHNKA